MPAILVEGNINRKITIQAIQGINLRLYRKSKTKRAGGVTQVIEHLPGKYKVLSSNPSSMGGRGERKEGERKRGRKGGKGKREGRRKEDRCGARIWFSGRICLACVRPSVLSPATYTHKKT
jgi:hypothetical protein